MVMVLVTVFSLGYLSFSANTLNESGHPPLKNFTPRHYGQHSQNWAVIQDDRGIMYFANGHGILEYDGVSWRLIETPRAARVRSLTKDRQGRIFVAASGDFGYLAPDNRGELQFISLLDFLPESERQIAEVWKTHATSTGVYFQTFNQLFFWNGERLTSWSTNQDFFLSAVVRDTLYVESRTRGLLKMVGDSLVPLPASESLIPLRIFSMLPLNEREILIATNRNGLYRLRGNDLRRFPTEVDPFLNENLLSNAVMLSDSTIALGTFRAGVVIIDRQGKLLQWLDRSAGLQDNDGKCLYADSEGWLWLALNFGISQVKTPTGFTYFTEKQGVTGLVSAITRHQGTLYTATSQGVFRLEKTTPPAPEGSPLSTTGPFSRAQPSFQPVSGIRHDALSLLSAGKSLLAGTNNGLYLIQKDQARRIEGTAEAVFTLHRSALDSTVVFAGLANGLAVYQFQGDRWIFTGTIDGIREEIRSIAEQADHTLWLGTMQQGLLRLKLNFSEKGKPLAMIERLTPEIVLPFGQIFTFRDKILAATQQGLRQWDEQQSRLIPAWQWGIDLTDSTRWISRVFFLPDSQFLIHSGTGNTGDYWAVRHKMDNTVQWDRSTFRILLSFGTIYSTHHDPDGIIWLGCNTGIVRYDPGMTGEKYQPPPPLVRRVSTISDSLIFAGGSSSPAFHPVLPYQKNSIRFEFALPSYTETAANQYQYILEGFDNQWSNWTTETYKEYTNLPEGNYRFLIQARNVYHQLSPPTLFPFKILPPWYRSWGAYAGYAVLFLIGIVLIDRLQRSRLLRKEITKARIREAKIIREKNWELQEVNEQLEKLLASLHQSQDQLSRSESRLRSVTETASDAIITADPAGSITLWNKRAEIIFGYTAQEALGQPLTILMPERYRQAHRQGMARLVTTGDTRISGQVVEMHGIRKNGEEFPIELTVSHGETHEGLFVTGIVRDITQRKQQQEMLERTQALLEAEHRRKSEELEKARLLQFSMLPSELPRLPQLNMDAHMKTATEVGGDYYDVHLTAGRTLTVVIGDATGHGLEAGMLVTATKSLFAKLADESDIIVLMEQINDGLRRLKLRRLYMALQLIRIKDYRMEVCTAGMPPVFIYRRQKSEVEEILIKQIPLGSSAAVTFQKHTAELYPGDIVIMFSDGLPERFNQRREYPGFEKIKAVFHDAAAAVPDKIIERLVEFGESWAGGVNQNDDETFVVLKIR